MEVFSLFKAEMKQFFFPFFHITHDKNEHSKLTNRIMNNHSKNH